MEKKKGLISPILPKSVGFGYAEKVFREITGKIKADEPDFLPKYEDSCWATLYANLTFDPNLVGCINIFPQTPTMIDCGFSLEVPDSYEMVVKPTLEFASVGFFYQVSSKDRVKIIVTNCSSDPYYVKHKQPIALMSFSPIWHCNFEETI